MSRPTVLTQLESKTNTSESMVKDNSSADWRDQLKNDMETYQQDLSKSEKSTVLNNKTTIDTDRFHIAEDNYRLEHGIAPTDEKGFWSRIADASLSHILALLAVIACSMLIAGEFSERTMKTMVSNPYSRRQLLSAKLLSVVLFSIILFAVAFVSMMAFMTMFFGTGGFSGKAFLRLGNKLYYISVVLKALIVYGLDFLETLVFISLTFMLAIVTRSHAVSTAISLIFLIGGTELSIQSAKYFNGCRLNFLANTGFSGFITDGTPYFGATLSFAILICAIYSLTMIIVGYTVFAKRDI
jgi:ABC-2 type transport system permease protein